jgi:hypothetical protein
MKIDIVNHKGFNPMGEFHLSCLFIDGHLTLHRDLIRLRLWRELFYQGPFYHKLKSFLETQTGGQLCGD